MRYQWILFDADETLFSFNSYLGLKNVHNRYGIEFSMQDYADFQAINQPLWVAYQNQKISATDIQTRRFAKLAQQTKQDPLLLNQQLMAEMALISKPLPNVVTTLEQLHHNVKLGIVTNGFTALQQERLKNTNTMKFFDMVVVSEQVGAAKPSRKVFEYALQQMVLLANPVAPQQVLMVGDTLASDILGGNNVGMDTCWFNPSHQANLTDIQPTYEISDMAQLIELLNLSPKANTP